MFLEYFNLVEQPFGVTPDPRYLFPTAGHREALASLVYGIESNLGFGTLIAQPGMGKTTLLFHIMEQYRQSARTAFIFNTQCDSLDFLRSLLSELDDQPVPEQTFHLQERFKQILSQELQARRRVIVVIDEAQNLGDMVMETIRLLSNFESANSKLLHIILAGQPDLAAKMGRPELSQLRQRIPIFASLPQLSSEETFSYVAHRLHIAGYRGRPLFTGQSMAGVAHLSRGIPREINRICFNCLSLACASSQTVVDVGLVNEVAADLGLKEHVMKEKEKDAEVQEPPAPQRGFVQAATTSIQPPPSQRHLEPAPKEVLKFETTPKPPVPMPAALRGSAAVVARKNPSPRGPRKTHPLVPFSFSYGWENARRPVAFALFYLTLIAAGWSTISQWAYPNSPADANTRASYDTKKPDPQSSSISWSELKGDAIGSNPESKTAKPSPVPSDARDASGVIGYQSSFELPITDPSSQASTVPELVRYVQPSYPEAARDRHLGGSVVLNVIVTKNGAVKDVRTISGDPILARAAESAVRKWSFRPSRVNGKPVEVSAEIVIHFSPNQVSNR